MIERIDFNELEPFDSISHDEEDEVPLLIADAHRCRDYISSQKWCAEVVDSYLGFGVGKIVSVCLFKIVPADGKADEWVWGIVGDIPSAYMTTDICFNAGAALDSYVGAMMEWVEAVKEGESVDNLIPVNVPPTTEWAESLESRLRYIHDEFLMTYFETEMRDNLSGRISSTDYF